MTYTPTLETIRAKMRRGDGTGSLFAADEMAVALQEITRLQGEVAALREAGNAMLQAADELMTEFVSKKRAANWGVINKAMVGMAKALAPRRG